MMTPKPPFYSVIIPIHNEEQSLPQLWFEIIQVMTDIKEPFELIFINDGSSDSSAEVMNALQNEDRCSIDIINIEKRKGQTFALKKGFEAARGAVVISLDADLQNDPADIPKFLAKLNAGYDVVCGWRKERQDNFFKKVFSNIGNFCQRSLTGLCVHDTACTMRVYERSCIDAIPLNWEGQHRFVPLAMALQGFRVGEVAVNHRPRMYGSSKYRKRRMFKVIFDFFRVILKRGK